MTNLSVIEHQGTFVIDSRLIAEELGIQHKNLLTTIEKYRDEIEEDWGAIAFETREFRTRQGNASTERFAYLTEQQATLLMTYSKNTEVVRQCKRNLVRSFEKAKRVIKEVIPAQSDRIRELELTLQIERERNRGREIDSSMITMHGVAAVLAVRGKEDQVVEIEKPVIEVIDEKTGVRFKGMTTKQMADYLTKKTGVKFKSGAQIEKFLEQIERDDLIAQTKRVCLQSYIPEEYVEEAIKVLTDGNRQMLLGE